MVAIAAASAFFTAASPETSAKTSAKLEVVSGNLDARGIKSKSKPASSSGLQVKANVQAPPKINGSTVGLPSGVENFNTDDEVTSPPPRTFINQLPDWSMLLAAVTTIFLAAEKQWMMLDWKPRRPDLHYDPFGLGRMVQDGLVFRQNFSIRSYEIGADRTASIETLMNHLQDSALNHVKTLGILSDGFGTTTEMSKRNLIWVVAKMQVLVDKYPMWGDAVQLDSWVCTSGKNGMRRDWVVSDYNTGEILTRASSVWVMMNKHTRRLSKIPDEVREEIIPYFMPCPPPPVVAEDRRKLPKLDDNTADYVRRGLSPRWNDLDVNQHVNNVKYIGWILESAPQSILESHEVLSITMEYRRECGKDSVLDSLTAVSNNGADDLLDSGNMECKHMLRLEDGSEVVRARTEWRPKCTNNFENVGQKVDLEMQCM